MRKTIAALAFATLGTGAAFALAGPAGAETIPSTEANQHQSANNTNSADQQAQTLISIPQINLNLPVSVLSPGAQTGDVDQSNRADVTASSGNDNSSSQGIDNAQRGDASSSVGSTERSTVEGSSVESDGHRGRGGDSTIGDTHVTGGDAALSQDQSADNTNSTGQSAETRVDVPQTNINVPISVLSGGARTGDVSQSNDAVVDAGSSNTNDSDQTIVQDQAGTAETSVDATIDRAIERTEEDHGDEGSDRRDRGDHRGHHGRDGDATIGDTTVTGGDATLDQDQSANNSNEATQDATTNVDVPQANSNEADTRVEGHHGDRWNQGRWNDGRWNDGHWNDGESMGDVTTGDVTHGNDTTVDASSDNSNDSVQGVDQVQEGSATSSTSATIWSALMAGVG